MLSDYGYWLVYPQATVQKQACRVFRSWLLAGPGDRAPVPRDALDA
jgi:hypothetical protein